MKYILKKTSGNGNVEFLQHGNWSFASKYFEEVLHHA